jgi:hypothetical protein
MQSCAAACSKHAEAPPRSHEATTGRWLHYYVYGDLASSRRLPHCLQPAGQLAGPPFPGRLRVVIFDIVC